MDRRWRKKSCPTLSQCALWEVHELGMQWKYTYIEHLPCARFCAGNSKELFLTTALGGGSIITPLYSWGKWSSERVSDLPKSHRLAQRNWDLSHLPFKISTKRSGILKESLKSFLSYSSISPKVIMSNALASRCFSFIFLFALGWLAFCRLMGQYIRGPESYKPGQDTRVILQTLELYYTSLISCSVCFLFCLTTPALP